MTKEEFITEMLEENNYLVLFFDNSIDWLQVETLFGIKKVKYQDKKDKEAFDILTQRINDCKTADELNEVLDWIETIKWEYDQFVDVGDQIAEWHFKHDAYKKTTTIHYIVTEWHGIEAVLYDDSIDWLIDSYPIDKNGNRIE